MNKKILTTIASILVMTFSIFGLSKSVVAKEVAYLSASSANTWLAASVKEMEAVASANGINITEFDAHNSTLLSRPHNYKMLLLQVNMMA